MNTQIEKLASIGAQAPILTAEEIAAKQCHRTHLLQAVRDANRFLTSYHADYYKTHEIEEPITVTERPNYTGVTVHSLGITRLVQKYATPESLLKQ